MGDGRCALRWLLGVVATAVVIGGVAWADDSLSARGLGEILVRKGLITREELQDALEETKKDRAAEAARPQEREQGQAAEAAPAEATKQTQAAEASRLEAIEAKLPKWLAMLTPFGDLRLRDEGFYQDELHARNRGRFRARLGLTVAPSDEVSATFRLASGNPNDPISNNQTFDSAFTKKPVNFDWAYITLKPTKTIGLDRPWLTVTAGKFGVNAYRPSELVWDEDVAVEGATEMLDLFERRQGFLHSVRVSAFQWIVDEVANGGDPWIPGGQVVVDMAPSERSAWTLALADYEYVHINEVAAKFLNPFTDPPTNSKPNSSFNSQLANSNSVVRDANGKILRYKDGFNILNLSTELNASDPFGMHLPAGLFGDFAYNTQANGRNVGLYAGAGIGNAGKDWYRDTLRNPGDWGVSYTYAWVEKDSVLSIFTFSDINEFSTRPAKSGAARPTQKGGTNLGVHIVRIDYVLFPNLQLTAKAYIENVLERKISDAALTGNPTLVRTQLDAMLRF